MTITWEQILAFLCEDQSMAITSLLFLAFFAAVHNPLYNAFSVSRRSNQGSDSVILYRTGHNL